MARFLVNIRIVTPLLVAFVVSGCQSTGNNWMTSWRERSKPKEEFKGLDSDNKEVVTYWPFKADKNKSKLATSTDRLKEKLARKSDQNKRDVQITEFLNEGDGFRKKKDWENARVAYEKAKMLAPENPDVRHRMAVVADQQGDYAAADEHYQAALRVRPRDPNLLSDIGYSYTIRGKDQLAEQTLKRALENDPSHKGAMANLGALYSKQNRYQDAMAMFRAGTNSDAEAQRYVAAFFPQDSINRTNEINPGSMGPAIASATATTPKSPEELRQLNFEQAKALAAREREEGIRRRMEADQRQNGRFLADDGLDQQQRFQSGSPNPNFNQVNSTNGQPSGGSQLQNGPAYAGNSMQGQPGLNGQNQYANGQNNGMAVGAANGQGYSTASYGSVSGTYADRGQNQQIQQVRPGAYPVQLAGAQQQQPMSANNYQHSNDPGNASQMATQLGLNAGPGGMFPVVPGAQGENTMPANQMASFNTRQGGEFQQASMYQNPQTWAANSVNPSSVQQTNRTDNIEGVPMIGPSSPSQNFNTPNSAVAIWQTGNETTLTWANKNGPGSGAAGTGIDPSSGFNPNGQNTNPIIGTDGVQSGMVPSQQTRTGIEASKPYNGIWPNPSSQTGGQPQGNSTGPRIGNNPGNIGVRISPSTSSNGQSSSLPMYPFAPNR